VAIYLFPSARLDISIYRIVSGAVSAATYEIVNCRWSRVVSPC